MGFNKLNYAIPGEHRRVPIPLSLDRMVPPRERDSGDFAYLKSHEYHHDKQQLAEPQFAFVMSALLMHR